MSNEKKEKIMNTAIKLFTEYGFHGTPTSKISKESGVSTGTLFNYFSTKEELINELYFKIKSSQGDEIKNCYDSNKGIVENLKSYWINIINWGISNPEKIIFKEQFCSSPFIDKLTKDKVKGHFGFIFEIYEDLTKENYITSDQLNFFRIYLHGTLDTTTVYAIKHREEIEDINKFITQSFDMFWKGFRK